MGTHIPPKAPYHAVSAGSLARNVKRNLETETPAVARSVFRVAAFGFSAASGFIVAEGVIVAGLYLLFGRLELPGDMSSSPTLVGLDVVALAVGVAASFVINERTTVRDVQARIRGGAGGALVRLGRFEGVSALGNAVVIMVQLALLAEFGLSPAIGSVVGAVAGFPVSYLASMRVVWDVRG